MDALVVGQGQRWRRPEERRIRTGKRVDDAAPRRSDPPAPVRPGVDPGPAAGWPRQHDGPARRIGRAPKRGARSLGPGRTSGRRRHAGARLEPLCGPQAPPRRATTWQRRRRHGGLAVGVATALLSLALGARTLFSPACDGTQGVRDRQGHPRRRVGRRRPVDPDRRRSPAGGCPVEHRPGLADGPDDPVLNAAIQRRRASRLVEQPHRWFDRLAPTSLAWTRWFECGRSTRQR